MRLPKIHFTALCLASYESELELPPCIDPNDKERILKYIRKHLDEAPVLELDFYQDLEDPEEAVTLIDIHSIS